MIDEKDVAEYVDELALYIDSEAPADLKVKVQEKIKTAIITGENKMSSIKEYFKQEGRIEGIQEGRKEGKEEGKMEGRKEGLEEGFKRVAFNMLKNGESAEKIALFTGLSTEQISSLYKQLLKNDGKDSISNS